jgi:hypothetical protein
MLTIVTGSSQNHHKSLTQFVNSFLHFYKNDEETRLVIYDLGLGDSIQDLKIITQFSTNVVYECFEFKNYPSYFDINVNAGEYAWKPIILHETCKKYEGNVVWMDAGNLILSRLDDLVTFLRKNGIHTGVTSGTITTWTHPKTLDAMKCDTRFLMLPNRNGACVGVNYSLHWVKEFVEKWKDYALNKDVIAPEGSSRQNHRQDQAVLSVLFYEYQSTYEFKIFHNLHYSIHNDCD